MGNICLSPICITVILPSVSQILQLCKPKTYTVLSQTTCTQKHHPSHYIPPFHYREVARVHPPKAPAPAVPPRVLHPPRRQAQGTACRLGEEMPPTWMKPSSSRNRHSKSQYFHQGSLYDSHKPVFDMTVSLTCHKLS